MAFNPEFLKRVLNMPREGLQSNHGFVQIDLSFREFLYILYHFLFIKFSAEKIITMPSSEFIFWKEKLSWNLSLHCPHLNNHYHQRNLIQNMSHINRIILTIFFPFWPPLKTSENQSFPDVFRGIQKELWEEKC